MVTILCWQPVGPVLWRWPAPVATLISWCFVGSWGALLYSLWLTGLGWQTGLTPWWHWVCRLPPPRGEFSERGAYRLLRHPVYLSFLGLVWFVPIVTLDRAVLIAVWSAYIFLGSMLKDRRLLHFLGEPYRDYQARVPGYPGLHWGPLARVPAGGSGRPVVPLSPVPTRCDIPC
jgi:protein-S-isoprenylcysteine O-methyltransferase Ste14